MKRAFVVGASGYIGGSVAARLVASGYSVTGLARSADKAARLRKQDFLIHILNDPEGL